MQLVASRDRARMNFPVILAGFLAIQLGLASAASAQLVNPAFDSGPAGNVGNFGTVVGPPFHAGFWGAENSSLVGTSVCGIGARSNPYMLQMAVLGDAQTEAWQAINVTGAPPARVTLRAWGNSCTASASPRFGIEIRTYNNANGWPNHTFSAASAISLDTNSATWEQVSLDCAAIPSDTQWILARVFFVNSTMGGTPGYVDDVALTFDSCPVPAVPTTWSTVKSVFGPRSR